jgi:signal transduction histidine kinase
VTGVVAVSGLFALSVNGIVTESMLPRNARYIVDFSSMSGFLIFFLLIAWILYRQRDAAVVARDELLSNRQKMIQTLAHDLKNPVAGIVSRIYLMERRMSVGTQVDSTSVIQAIKKDASSVLESIDQMILLNRSKTVNRAPNVVPCDLRSVIDDSAELHKQWMDAKGIRFDDSSIIATRVLGDRELLVRLFENIISNAVKYSNPQSKIECRVRELTEDNKPMVVIEIADKGLGMDPREAEFFFKLEYRPNRPTAGESSSGVGAALMNEIIMAHGGKIWLKSEGRDLGTTVSVQLRRARD